MWWTDKICSVFIWFRLMSLGYHFLKNIFSVQMVLLLIGNWNVSMKIINNETFLTIFYKLNCQSFLQTFDAIFKSNFLNSNYYSESRDLCTCLLGFSLSCLHPLNPKWRWVEFSMQISATQHPKIGSCTIFVMHIVLHTVPDMRKDANLRT